MKNETFDSKKTTHVRKPQGAGVVTYLVLTELTVASSSQHICMFDFECLPSPCRQSRAQTKQGWITTHVWPWFSL